MSLAKNLKLWLKKILKNDGWDTERRRRLLGRSGSKSEIDILATRKRKGRCQQLAVECKNHLRSVSIKDLRDFSAKLEDLNIPKGLFVTYSNFSSEVIKYGESKGIELWDHNEVRERLFSIEAGRGTRPKEYRIPLGLPLNVSFDEAIALNLENSDCVDVLSSKLIWRPFYKLSYNLKATRRYPTKQLHTFTDSGDCIIDPFTGHLVDFINTKDISLKKLAKKMKLLKTTEEDLNVKEIKHFHPEKNIIVKQREEFDVHILDPKISPVQARRRALQEITERNTIEIEYDVKNEKKR